MALTNRDIDLLIRERSPKVRADLVAKIATDFNGGRFNEVEKHLAFDIFRLLLKDIEVRVRRALSENLHSNLEVPPDIALRLSQDVAEVAIPMLEHSYVLTEEDLMEIVQSTRSALKLEAVARRPSISRSLSGALIHTQIPSVLSTLFGNKCASLSDEDVIKTLEKMQHENAVLSALVERGGLSLTIVEKLFLYVSDELKNHLSCQYKLKSHIASESLDVAREWSTLRIIKKESTPDDIMDLVTHLHSSGRLSHSMVLRSLCMGDLRFFNHAMSKLAGVDYANTCMLLLDPGGLGFKALYDASGMPEGFYGAVETLHRLALEETAYGRFQQEDFKKRIIHRLIREGYDREVENMSYIITLIGAMPAQEESDATLH